VAEEPPAPRVVVIGVAHVVDVGQALRRQLEARPLDAIALELDVDRYRALLAPPGNGAHRGGGPVLLRLWAQMQQRLGDELGAGAGAEMRAAAQIAMERKLPVLLIDDPIRETLSRLFRSLSVKERVTLLTGAVVGLFLPGPVVSQQLQAYQAEPTSYLEEMRRVMPGVARVLLDDRNEHMAARLLEAQRRGLPRLAAVVGDAHLPGLCAVLGRQGVATEQIPFSALAKPRGP
jgi:pheromone shutdown protein TraB